MDLAIVVAFLFGGFVGMFVGTFALSLCMMASRSEARVRRSDSTRVTNPFYSL